MDAYQKAWAVLYVIVLITFGIVLFYPNLCCNIVLGFMIWWVVAIALSFILLVARKMREE